MNVMYYVLFILSRSQIDIFYFISSRNFVFLCTVKKTCIAILFYKYDNCKRKSPANLFSSRIRNFSFYSISNPSTKPYIIALSPSTSFSSLHPIWTHPAGHAHQSARVERYLWYTHIYIFCIVRAIGQVGFRIFDVNQEKRKNGTKTRVRNEQLMHNTLARSYGKGFGWVQRICGYIDKERMGHVDLYCKWRAGIYKRMPDQGTLCGCRMVYYPLKGAHKYRINKYPKYRLY